MEIRTKFDKKDRVVTIDCTVVKQFVAEKTSIVGEFRELKIWFIRSINSEISSCNLINGEVIYGLAGEYQFSLSENEPAKLGEAKEINCFATEEEAQAECDRRNKNDSRN